MYCKLALATLAVIIGNDFAFAEQIPSTTTAAEMWNPWTWFWPYAIASAEGYRDYYQKAQKATNELYQQIYKTNAFPWVTGNWGPSQPQPQPQPQPNQNGGQSNQEGQNTEGGAGKQPKPSEDSETTTEKPAQEGETTKPAEEKNEENQTQPEGTGAQGQNTEGGAGKQPKPSEDSETNTEKPAQEGETTKPAEEKNEENQTQPEGTGAQVQGNVQDDGTADAEVKPN